MNFLKDREQEFQSRITGAGYLMIFVSEHFSRPVFPEVVFRIHRC